VTATPTSPDQTQADAAAPAAEALPEAETLEASLAYCRQVARRKAGNFYYGMCLTPRDRRLAMYVVYTWMRAADDLADEPGDQSTKVQRIDRFRALTDQAAAGELPNDEGVTDYPAMWPAVVHVLERFPIELPVLHDVVAGQLADQEQTQFATFDDLYRYCYQVASTVGLVSISVWGYEGGDETRKLAEQRGIALQLTNIIRDVVEDAQRGRVYIPEDELQACDLDRETFLTAVEQRRFDHRMEKLMRKQITRAKNYYDRSVALEGRVAADCRPTCWAMMRIYRAILDKIQSAPERVLHERVSLSKVDKLRIAGRAAVRRGLRRVGLFG